MSAQRLKLSTVIILLILLTGTNPVWAGDGHALIMSSALAKSVTTCNSCSDCSTKLASEAYALVRLTTDIIDHGGACIATVYGESDNTFDCDGHLIDGDDIAIDPEQGIALYHGSNNTIRNCRVSDFSIGILLQDATNQTVENSSMFSNGIGLKLNLATFSVIEGNTFEDNYTGISMYMADNSTLTGNRVCSNIITDFEVASTCGQSGTANQCNIPDGWNDDGTTGCTFPCWTCWLHLPIITR
jgi:parallel beta-helix repeat protein